MAKMTRGFGMDIANQVLDELKTEAEAQEAAIPPEAAVAADAEVPASGVKTGVLHSRNKALTSISDKHVYETLLWVDPKECKPSSVNARDYAKLNKENCADVISSIQAEGKQLFPAVVRRTNDPETPYEIVSGLRRHFSISWLNANNYPDFRYLISIKEMDDESAWRLSDVENRSRKDITDYERAVSYRDALAQYYGGSTERMAERIKISVRNLRRYIQLADLDKIIVDAIGGEDLVKVAHAVTIQPELGKSKMNREAILAEAEALAKQQAERRTKGESLIPPTDAVKRLIKASTKKLNLNTRTKPVEILSKSGKPLLEFVPVGRSGLSIKIHKKIDASLEELKAEMEKILEEAYSKLKS